MFQFNRPHNLCATLALHSASSVWRRDPPRVILALVDECISLASEHGLPHYISFASIIRGWSFVRLGAVGEGIEQIRKATAMWRALGSHVALPLFLILLAESQIASGEPEEALKTTDEALTWIDNNDERQAECMVRCCRGDAFCDLGIVGSARIEYEAAVCTARKQEGKWWELHAVIPPP